METSLTETFTYVLKKLQAVKDTKYFHTFKIYRNLTKFINKQLIEQKIKSSAKFRLISKIAFAKPLLALGLLQSLTRPIGKRKKKS